MDSSFLELLWLNIFSKKCLMLIHKKMEKMKLDHLNELY
jgi:hypothetical protein